MRFAKFLPAAVLLWSTLGFAVEFRAEADREEIAQDESVSVKMTVEADGTVPIEAPQFSAPGFDEIQNFQGSFVQSYYDSNAGKFSAKFSRSFTYVLRPKNTGRLAITNIHIQVDGKQYAANPLTIIVTGGGAGTPPPKGYGGAGSGLRGMAKKNGRGTVLFIRTEVDKTKVYKGQQIIVNYYLYSRVQNFNAGAERYPNLNGFLKEELEIPVLTGRLDPHDVVLDGTAYKRALVASFAAYPLKEGKLTIDPMEVKATYIAERGQGPGAGGGFGDEDDLFQQFFRSAQPQIESLRSEPITIEVAAMPPPPKDLAFTGAVGEYDVIAAVDRNDLKANEAVTLTLKIEGSGNISNIETPKIPLPDGFELYEAKSQTKGKGGIGEKDFQYLLIPRKPGDFTIPRIELGFFDPKKGEYTRKATDPIQIHVNAGDPGSENQPPPHFEAGKEAASPLKDSKRIFDLFSGSNPGATGDAAGGRIRGKGPIRLILFGVLGLIVLLGILIRFRKELQSAVGALASRSRKKNRREREWAKLRRQAEEAGRLPFNEILKCFDYLQSQLEEALSERYGITARGLTREQLKAALVGEGLIAENLWQRLSGLLEFTETVRFASQAGAVSEERARGELRKWIVECEAILANLSSPA